MFKKKSALKKKRFNKKRGNRKPKNKLLGLMPSVDNIQKAQMVETYQPSATIAPNTAYSFATVITNYPRAMKMAALFKFYRAKRIVYEYLPDQNTFQAGAGQVAIPYAYWLMNRDGVSGTGTTPNQYRAAGARPVKFTQKLLISYKPNTVQISDIVQSSSIPAGSNQNVSIGRTPLYDKWFSTEGLSDPGAGYIAGTVSRGDGSTIPLSQPAFTLPVVMYMGHDVFFEQTGAPIEDVIGRFSISVEWEFKVPRFDEAT